MKQHGQCFVLDEFDGVPQDIKNWERVQTHVVSTNMLHTLTTYTVEQT